MSEWSLIVSLDAPSAGAFSFTGLSLGTYKRIRVEILGVTVTTDGTDVGIQTSHGSGFVTTNYLWALNAESSSNTANADTNTGQGDGRLMGNDANWDTGNAATKGMQAIVDICDPGDTAAYKLMCFRSMGVGPTGNSIVNSGMAYVANAGAIDGIKVLGSSNLINGFVRIWGMT